MKINDFADAVKTNPIYAIGIKPNFPPPAYSGGSLFGAGQWSYFIVDRDSKLSIITLANQAGKALAYRKW